eukprot:2983928-Heterocapsa_arctica.AAC.1
MGRPRRNSGRSSRAAAARRRPHLARQPRPRTGPPASSSALGAPSRTTAARRSLWPALPEAAGS